MLIKSLCRCSPAERLAWTAVERGGDGGDLVGAPAAGSTGDRDISEFGGVLWVGQELLGQRSLSGFRPGLMGLRGSLRQRRLGCRSPRCGRMCMTRLCWCRLIASPDRTRGRRDDRVDRQR